MMRRKQKSNNGANKELPFATSVINKQQYKRGRLVYHIPREQQKPAQDVLFCPSSRVACTNGPRRGGFNFRQMEHYGPFSSSPNSFLVGSFLDNQRPFGNYFFALAFFLKKRRKNRIFY
jgi:hypothetical protein